MKKPPRILPHVLKRVLPVTMLGLLVFWAGVRIMAASTIRGQVHDRISYAARHEARAIGTSLHHLIDHIRDLAGNDLIINSLIDTTARESYLAPFFQSLRVHGTYSIHFALTDFRGRVVASNRPEGPSYGKEPWFERTMDGKEHIQISARGLEVAMPVFYHGLPEGVLIAAFEPEIVSQIVFSFPENNILTVFDPQGGRLFASAEAPWNPELPGNRTPAKGWIQATQSIPGFPGLTLITGEREDEALRPLRRLDLFFLLATALNVLALGAAVFLAGRMVASPLSTLVHRMDNITDFHVHNDPVPETGPSEFRNLARSFNRLLADLTRATWQMRKRMKELDCLYHVSLVFETGETLPDILQGTLDRVSEGMVYPEITCARIVLGEEVLRSRQDCGRCRDCSNAHLSNEIMVFGLPAGEIRVSYLEERPSQDKSPFLAEEGRLVEMIAYRLGQAIERLRTKEALRESEEELNLALYGADLGTWDWDVPTGVVKRNERCASLLGYGPEGLEGDTVSWERSIHPDDRMNVRTAFNNHLAGESGGFESEYRVGGPSGDWIWVLDRGRVMERDQQGNPVRVCGTLLDITDRKRAEEEARVAQALRAQEAGRAQMAAKVLHHIGNAITPVKVYVEELGEEGHGRASIGYLEKAYSDLQDHRSDLQNYVNDSGRGAQVFDFMGSLIAALKEQALHREQLVQEIESGITRVSRMLLGQQPYENVKPHDPKIEGPQIQ